MNLKFQTAIVICLIALLGGAMQLAFWKTENNTIAEALLSHGYLWIVYFLVGVFAAEHVLNYFRRCREKRNRQKKNRG